MRLGPATLCALLALLATAVAGADPVAVAATVAADPPLVKVEFYGEALCPYCVEFTLKSLAPLYDQGIFQSRHDAIASVEYIPWGNARYNGSTGEIECQHGARECQLNAVFSCAINARPDGWFPFVHCVESGALQAGEGGTRRLVQRCAEDQGLDGDALLDCAAGEAGRYLQLQAAHRTHSLRPAHLGVPWVLVNGIPLEDDTPNVFKYICAAYTGPRPNSCFELSEPDNGDKAAEQGSALKGLATKQLTLRSAEYRRMMTQ